MYLLGYILCIGDVSFGIYLTYGGGYILVMGDIFYLKVGMSDSSFVHKCGSSTPSKTASFFIKERRLFYSSTFSFYSSTFFGH
jgi:hypothetical protein